MFMCAHTLLGDLRLSLEESKENALEINHSELAPPRIGIFQPGIGMDDSLT